MNKLLFSGIAALGLRSAAWPAMRRLRLRIRTSIGTACTCRGTAAYADETYGGPIALVVPPTVGLQKQYSWGVCSSRVTPIYHQFARPYPGPGAGYVGRGFFPTPEFPSDTTQFGVYYIRGPW